MPGSFLDSNVLLYVMSTELAKKERAEALMRAGGVISVQVLNEIASVSRRKLGLSWDDVAKLLYRIRLSLVVEPLLIETHDLGIRIARRHTLAFYDSMLVAAALIAGCDAFWSEDMHDGLVIEGRLTIRNPFSPGAFG